MLFYLISFSPLAFFCFVRLGVVSRDVTQSNRCEYKVYPTCILLPFSHSYSPLFCHVLFLLSSPLPSQHAFPLFFLVSWSLF